MRKVIKIFLNVVSSLVLAAIIIPVTVWLLLFLPPVQNFVVRLGSDYASELLGTTVSFERVHLRLFNAAAFDGLYLEDYRHDTLLYVGRMSAGVDTRALLRREILLTDVRLEHGEIRVRRYEDGQSNIGQIFARFQSEDPVTLKLHATSVEMRDMAFSYRTHSPKQTEGVMNFGDLGFSDVGMKATDLSVRGDTVSVRLDRLSLHEKSGFALDRFFSDRITLGPGGVRIGETRIATPDSEIFIDHAYLDKTGEQGFADFMNDTFVNAEIRSSTVGAQTAGYFIPAVRRMGGSISGFNASVMGRPADVSGWVTAGALDSTRVSMLFAVRGLPDIQHTQFSFTLDSLVTNAADIHELADLLTGSPVADTLSQHISTLGTVVLKGNFTGRLHDFTARANLRTAQGSGKADLVFSPSLKGDGRTDFAGKLMLDNLELGALLGAAKVGRLSVASDLDGTYGRDYLSAEISADLSGLEFNGYNYHDVRLDGRVYRRQFTGEISSRDPNLDMDFDGLLDFNGAVPLYDFAIKMRNADLARLNFNRRDSVSRVCFDARVAGSGSNLDDMNGEIRIANMLYINPVDSIRTGEIVIAGRNNAESKLLSLTSDFADASFRSRMSYARLGKYLENTLLAYLPSLSRREHTVHPCLNEPGIVDDFSVVNIEVKEANNVAGIFLPGLIVAKGSKITAMFNPHNERLSLKANSDYIEMGSSFISKLEINGGNQADSVSLFVRADEVYAGGFLLPGVSVIGGARDNRVSVSAHYADTAQERSALIGATVELSRGREGQPQALLRFTPSYYRQGNQQWNVFTRGIRADRRRIEVDDFAIEGNGQSLRISGVASESVRDTLQIELSNFDINPLSSVINMGYQFYGRASGRAYIQSPMRSPILNARIELDSMMVDRVHVPQLVFLSNWEADNSRVRMMMLEQGKNEPIISASFLPATRRIEGWMKLDGVDLSLLDTHYEGTLSRTTGRADLNATIGGYGRNIKLNGTVDIREYTAAVDFLNVSYSTVGTPQMALKDNVLTGTAIPLADPEGNHGTLDARIDLNKLNNVAYQFDIRVNNMLLLNTTQADNELFYGKVYGSGAAEIRGSKRGVSLNITAATEGDSHFYMPLEDKTDMADVDFVRFVEPSRRQTVDSTEYNIRKRMIMTRQQQRNQRIESSGNVNTDIALTVKPNTYVELLIDPQTGHTVHARGNGSLNLHVNPCNSEFTMYGDYRITEGVYLFTLENIIEKPFAIEPGSNIQWTGDPIDALLNISGVYRLKSSIGAAVSNTGFSDRGMRIPIECRIMLTERLALPTLTFNITAPGATPEVQNILSGYLNTQEMIATQFFFLLATGNFYDYDGSAGNIGAAAGSATAFDFLSNQFSNWISSDRFNIGIRYRPQTETTSDEWGIDLSQQLLGDRLLLEIEGSYDTQNNSRVEYSDNMKNFTGDFYLTGLLDRTRNLKAKLFSRTITRFDENQGLQEWGAGLYFTEDFNTFGDVIRNFRERFTGERRRKRLLLKQTVEEYESDYKEITNEEQEKSEESGEATDIGTDDKNE